MNLIDLPTLDPANPVGKTIIEDVYVSLRHGILNGILKPGSRLRVEELRQKYGVGASTVREALSRLLAENLVTTEGQRGFRVAPVSLADFQNIAQMRTLLEVEAIRESIERGDEDWEARVVAAAHRLSKVETAMRGQEAAAASEWEERNRAFHDALISACTNTWLLNFRGILYRHSARYLRMALTDTQTPRDVRAEHQALFDAVMDRDADRAARITAEHIDRSVAVIAAQLDGLVS